MTLKLPERPELKYMHAQGLCGVGSERIGNGMHIDKKETLRRGRVSVPARRLRLAHQGKITLDEFGFSIGIGYANHIIIGTRILFLALK